MQSAAKQVTNYYLNARAWLESTPYVDEINWQERLLLSDVTETQLLREHAWVVLNSGFREKTVRKYFDYISLCFCDWESANVILENERVCFDSAIAVFGNSRKLRAIIEMARLVSVKGAAGLIETIGNDPIATLTSLPFVGDITAWHLAKNLGIDVAKPDRHLVRLAERFGYKNVHRMCEDIHVDVGDRVSVVDIVLWRYEESCGERINLNTPQFSSTEHPSHLNVHRSLELDLAN